MPSRCSISAINLVHSSCVTSSRVAYFASQDDVGTAAGHVLGDRDRALAAGLGDDLRLAFVMLRVEHLMLDAALLQEPRQPLALFDRHGADQDRPAGRLDVLDLVTRND